jgi:hypothetical protein
MRAIAATPRPGLSPASPVLVDNGGTRLALRSGFAAVILSRAAKAPPGTIVPMQRSNSGERGKLSAQGCLVLPGCSADGPALQELHKEPVDSKYCWSV